MTFSTTKGPRYGALVALLVSGATGCGKDPEAEFTLPPVPEDCSATLPESVLTPVNAECGTWCRFARYGGIRAFGDTVYFLGDDGVYSVEVPEGSPSLLVPFPPDTTVEDPEPPGLTWFRDFWVDDSSITGVYRGALFQAPRAGGEAQLVPGTTPRFEGEEFAEAFVRGGDFLYSTHIVNVRRIVVERMPWGGGEREKVWTLEDVPSPEGLIAGSDAVYVTENYSGRTLALPFDGDPEIASDSHHEELLGAEDLPYFLGIRVVQDGDRPRPQLVVTNGTTVGTPTGLDLPQNWLQSTLGNVRHARLVRFEDALYFYVDAMYAAKDDRREVYRQLLVRLERDLSGYEVVRCIPPQPFDPTLPEGGGDTHVNDIAVSESGIFALRVDGSNLSGRERPHAVKIWP